MILVITEETKGRRAKKHPFLTNMAIWMAKIKPFIYLPVYFFTCLLTFLEREEGPHPSSPLIPAGLSS